MVFTRRRKEIAAIHDAPFLELIFQAAAVHRKFNDPSMVRALVTMPTCHHLSTLLQAVARGLDHGGRSCPGRCSGAPC